MMKVKSVGIFFRALERNNKDIKVSKMPNVSLKADHVIKILLFVKLVCDTTGNHKGDDDSCVVNPVAYVRNYMLTLAVPLDRRLHSRPWCSIKAKSVSAYDILTT